MQITINHSQLEALIKAGIIDVEAFSRCLIDTREGDFIDAKGNKVLRTTIYVPAQNAMVSGADLVNAITGRAVEAFSKKGDDLEAELCK